MLYSSVYATHGIAGGELDDGRPRRLSDLLREGFDGFSRSQKAIARFIIDHLEEVGYLSAEELGEKGSTSSSTVVQIRPIPWVSPAIQNCRRRRATSTVWGPRRGR